MAADGTTYVGSDDGHVFALAPGGAQLLWRTATGSAVIASPALTAGGLVVVGSYSGGLRALSAATGAQAWVHAAGGPLTASPVVTPADTVVFASGSWVVCVAAATGAQVWAVNTLAPVTVSPALSPDGAVVYVPGADMELYAPRTSDGSPVWQVFTGAVGTQAPLVSADGGALLAEAFNGLAPHPALGRYDAATGALEWQYTVGGGDHALGARRRSAPTAPRCTRARARQQWTRSSRF